MEGQKRGSLLRCGNSWGTVVHGGESLSGLSPMETEGLNGSYLEAWKILGGDGRFPWGVEGLEGLSWVKAEGLKGPFLEGQKVLRVCYFKVGSSLETVIVRWVEAPWGTVAVGSGIYSTLYVCTPCRGLRVCWCCKNFFTKLQLLLWKATMVAAVVTGGLEGLLLQKILQL